MAHPRSLPFPHPPQPLRHIQESPARDRARGAPERRDVDRHGDASPRGWELDHVQVEGGPVPAAARDHHPLRTVGDVVHEPVRREEGDEPPVRTKVGADAGAGEGGETPSQQREFYVYLRPSCRCYFFIFRMVQIHLMVRTYLSRLFIYSFPPSPR